MYVKSYDSQLREIYYKVNHYVKKSSQFRINQIINYLSYLYITFLFHIKMVIYILSLKISIH